MRGRNRCTCNPFLWLKLAGECPAPAARNQNGIAGERMARHRSVSTRSCHTKDRRTRQHRILDALGYVALALLVALTTYRQANFVFRGPVPQVATSAGVTGASTQPVANR